MLTLSPANRSGRSVDGILLLDKPLGVGSNEALQKVKRLFKARKAGHTGSLDRLATGLLPLCFGEATKLSGFLLNAEKRYEAVLRLGIVTSTGDAEGEVLESCEVPRYSCRELEEVVSGFEGEISQVPPMHSAVKVGGQRLYRLAHKGMVIERAPRTVTIHRIAVTDYREGLLSVEVACSKGTYVRTLAEDIDKALGCGASVAGLHRVGSGPFDASEMHGLAELQALADAGLDALDRTLVPMESALEGFPDVKLTGNVAYYLRKGQAVMVPHAPTSGWVKLYDGSCVFLGVGEVLGDGRIAPRRLINRPR